MKTNFKISQRDFKRSMSRENSLIKSHCKEGKKKPSLKYRTSLKEHFKRQTIESGEYWHQMAGPGSLYKQTLDWHVADRCSRIESGDLKEEASKVTLDQALN
jgi:hypothetical protein